MSRGLRTKNKFGKSQSLTKNIKSAEREIINATRKAEREKKRLEKLKSIYKVKDNKKHILDTSDMELLGYDEKKKIAEKTIIFQPHEGPQTEFLAANEDEVLFSGARGSGKSIALIVDPLRYCENKNFRALVIRKTMPELRELVSSARDIYPQVFPGVKWKEQEKLFIFPSGARVEFGHLESEGDVERYRGQQYTWIGIDELTHIEREDTFDRLMGSARTVDASLKVYKRFTTNPNGPGRVWVKRRFIDLGPASTKIEVPVKTSLGTVVITRRWIDSRTTDNPTLIKNDPMYLANLANLPEVLRKAWLEGDWTVAEGVAFPDFNARTHVVTPFEIPRNWLRFRACDWGFTSMAVCLWFALDEDNCIYVYREYKTKLVPADQFAANVLALEEKDNVKYGVIDGSVGDQRGISGPTVDEQMRQVGCRWRYADKSPGSRIAGKNLIHQLLANNQFTNKPKLQVFTNCKELIEEMSSLPIDKNDAEDVDTNCDDHAYDALRYGLMSRPNIVSAFEGWASSNPNPRPAVIDPIFGY